MKSTHLVKIERIVIFPRGVAAAIHGVVQVRLIGRVFSQTLDVESRVAARPRFQVDGFQRRQVAGVLLEQLQALGVVVCQRILAGIRRFLARVHHVCRKGAGGVVASMACSKRRHLPYLPVDRSIKETRVGQ